MPQQLFDRVSVSRPRFRRRFAYAAGFIHRGSGTWAMLGELVLDIALEPDPPQKRRCGTCHACIDARAWNRFAVAAQRDQIGARPHAAWALGRIGDEPARAALAAALSRESDPDARGEMASALPDGRV